MKELLQKIYEQILGLLGQVSELFRKLWEMPAEDFLALLWAGIRPWLTFLPVVIVVLIGWVIIRLIINVIPEIRKVMAKQIAVYRERKNRS